MPTFDLVSDVHIELVPETKHQSLIAWPDVSLTRDRYLILAGDIGRIVQPAWGQWIATAASRYSQTLVVLGNHEYYVGCKQQRFSDLTNRARQIIDAIPNCTLLHRDSFVIENVLVLGCVLWTHLAPTNRHLPEILEGLNDFHRIYVGQGRPHPLTLAERNAEHDLDRQWLQEWLHHPTLTQQAMKTLVITHHAPHPDCQQDEKYRDSPFEAAFVNKDLDMTGVHTWVYGHIHEQHVISRNGVRLITNCTGYPGEEGLSLPTPVYTFTL